MRRLYHWVLSWAEHPQATVALFVLSFAEASFFPIPPDVLLIALCLGQPRRALWFAGVCTAGSICGAVGGYLIGTAVFETVGRPILEFYHLMDRFSDVQARYEQYGAWAVGIAGFTPIPFKVFTVAAGVFQIPVVGFVVASAISRGLRFGLVALLLKRWGEPAREFIDRHLGLLSVVFTVLLVGGFLALQLLF